LLQGVLLLYKGVSYHYLNRPELRHAAFDEARILMENRLKEVPESYYCHSILGFALCGLGQKEQAIREGEIAVELISDDQYLGPSLLEGLARIYACVDEEDKAIDILEQLMETHYSEPISVWDLKKNVSWNPLRDNPRFQKLIEKYSGKKS